VKLYLLIIIISLVAGTLLFFFFIGDDYGLTFGQKDPENTESEISFGGQEETLAVSVTDEVAIAELPEVSLLVDTECIGLRLSDDGQVIWFYDGIGKRLRQVNLKGEDVAAGLELANDVADIIWSPDGSQFIYHSGSGKYYLYNINSQEEILLGTNIESPVWISSDQICYRFIESDDNASSLRTGTPGSGLTDSLEIMPAGASSVLKKIPNSSQVAYYLTPSENVPSAVYSISQNGDKSLLISKNAALEAEWSPRGDLLAFSRINEGRLELLAAGPDGSNPVKLARSTFIDKIVFTNGRGGLYAGVPKRIPNFTKYQQAEAGTEDDLYYLSSDGSEAKLVNDFANFTEKIDARNLFLSQNGKLLYFINSYSNSLYVVNLSKIEF